MLCHHVHIITTPPHSTHPSTMQGNENYNNFKTSTYRSNWCLCSYGMRANVMHYEISRGSRFVCGNVQAAGIVNEWV